MSLLSAQEVMDIIPNRYPIFFIDKVEELTPGEHIVCYKNVTINEPFFQGHFPGEPVMPGVLIVEALAQAGSIPLLTLPDFKGQTAYLGGLNKVKFRQKVVPGDVLRLQVDIVKLNAEIAEIVAREDALRLEIDKIIAEIEVQK